jgi:hypothetical protein
MTANKIATFVRIAGFYPLIGQRAGHSDATTCVHTSFISLNAG